MRVIQRAISPHNILETPVTEMSAGRVVALWTTVVQNMQHAGVAGIVVATRSDLLSALGLPREKRIVPSIDPDLDSEMIDSIERGLTVLAKKRPPTGIDEQDVTVGLRVRPCS